MLNPLETKAQDLFYEDGYMESQEDEWRSGFLSDIGICPMCNINEIANGLGFCNSCIDKINKYQKEGWFKWESL